MKKIKRILSLLLAAMMLVGVLPLSIMAEDGKHTVKFNWNYAGTTKVVKIEVGDGECVEELTDAERKGYTLKGWSTAKYGGNLFDFSKPITEDVTLYAQWKIDRKSQATALDKTINDVMSKMHKRYTVTFETDGGTVIQPVTVKYKDTIAEVTPKKENYEFIGWYTDADFTEAYDFSTEITEDITLYAKWKKNTYSVTFETDGGTAVEGQTVEHGDVAAKPADPTKDEYTFAGWYADADLTKEYDFTKAVEKDLVLYAKWEKNGCTVTFDSAGGTAVEDQKVEPGELAIVPASPEKEGHLFVGWYVDATYSELFDFTKPVDCDYDLVARWINTEDTTDTDGDGLTDSIEEYFGTDKNSPDTDNDGLTDDVEILVIGLNPLAADTDSDGIIDADEDLDEDGLSNIYEITNGTEPLYADTDDDGLADGDEVNVYGTSPTNDDTDGDSLTDGYEIELGLNPLEQKTDGEVLDSERVFTKSLNEDNISDALLSDENDAVPSLSLTADSLTLANVYIEPTRSNDFGDSRAIVGTPVDVKGDNITEGVISFTLNSDGIFALGVDESGNTYSTGLICKYNEDGTTEYFDTNYDADSNTLSASISSEGTYFVMDVKSLFDELGLSFPTASPMRMRMMRSAASTGGTSESVGVRAQADIVFIVDTTGSMSDEIRNVKNNISYFVDALNEKGISAALALIDYEDITVDGYDSTRVHKNGSSNWFYDVNDYKTAIGNLTLGNGGDWPECVVDALETARLLDMRASAGKIFILVTDADYKVDNRYDIPSLAAEIELLKNAEVSCSVVSPTSEKSTYYNLYTDTDGLWANIYGDFYEELMALADKIGSDIVGDGYWIYLNGPIPVPVRLDAMPEEGSTVDTDDDGIPDIEELKEYTPSGYVDLDELITKVSRGVITGTDYGMVMMYKYGSNPADPDTDDDGILDKSDSDVNTWNVSYRDLVILADTVYEDYPAGTVLSSTDRKLTVEGYGVAGSTSELKGWTVLMSVYNPLTGFEGAAYAKDNNLVIAFRGSESHDMADLLQDWLCADIIGYLSGLNWQLPAMETFVENVVNKYGSSYDNIYVTGHSLGGYLALMSSSQLLWRGMKDKIEGVLTFNGLGLSPMSGILDLDDYVNLQSIRSKIKNYRTYSDIVSIIGSTPGDDISVPQATSLGYGIGSAHSLVTFVERFSNEQRKPEYDVTHHGLNDEK